MDGKAKKYVAIGAIAVIVLVFGGIWATQNIGKSDRVVGEEQGAASISKMAEQIGASEAPLVKSAIEYSDDAGSAADELPDIETMPVVAEPTTAEYAEIYAVSNIAGDGDDGWMADMAREFNASGAKVGGKPVSVKVRRVASGYAFDYISSGKAVPQGFCPSNGLWTSMLAAGGVKVDTVRKSMVRDVAGILLKKDAQQKLVSEYGSVDMKAVTEAVADGSLSFGYTNPFTSATGMNFLVSTLLRYDAENPLSDDAADGFRKFQQNVPLVSLTTQQMAKAAENGTLDGFVNEYQVYSKDPAMQAEYEFTPFGFRHDYPLVAVGEPTATQRDTLEAFAEFCEENGDELAKRDGFGGMDSYSCEAVMPDGKTLVAAEKFYKKNKDAGNPVIAVFVADVSGSMSGAPLQSLQSSLVSSMKYINSENYIGLVTYSDDVTVALPIDRFDMEHQTYFKGAVESMSPGGGTATFDGIVVAADMIRKKMEEVPNAKPMIFTLSDGDTNRGYTLKDVSGALQGLRYPIYTIGYNANISALSEISDINEAASINADTDDVAYQLKTLFNANM